MAKVVVVDRAGKETREIKVDPAETHVTAEEATAPPRNNGVPQTGGWSGYDPGMLWDEAMTATWRSTF